MRNQSAFALLMQNSPTQLCSGSNPFAFPSDSCTKHMGCSSEGQAAEIHQFIKKPHIETKPSETLLSNALAQMVQKLPRTWIYLIWIGVPSAEESSKSHEPVPNHCCMNLSPDSTVELPYLHSAVRGGDKSIPGTLGINHRKWQNPRALLPVFWLWLPSGGAAGIQWQWQRWQQFQTHGQLQQFVSLECNKDEKYTA